MKVQVNPLANVPMENPNVKRNKTTLESLKIDIKTDKSENNDKLVNNTKKSKDIPKNINFDQLENNDKNGICPIANKISDSAMENATNKISYKDRVDLDHGNLACAYAVSSILNKLPEFKNVHQNECANLSKDLMKKGFENIFTAKEPEKKQPEDFKVGDIVFFPRETEQYGLKNMGHVGIVAKDKETGELMMVNNGWALDKTDGKYSTESRVMAVPLEKYLSEKNVTMILRHK